MQYTSACGVSVAPPGCHARFGTHRLAWLARRSARRLSSLYDTCGPAPPHPYHRPAGV
jgi:hypothetical protein